MIASSVAANWLHRGLLDHRRLKRPRPNWAKAFENPGARDGTRTRDPHVGKSRRGRTRALGCGLVPGEGRRIAEGRGTGNGRRHPGGTGWAYALGIAGDRKR